METIKKVPAAVPAKKFVDRHTVKITWFGTVTLCLAVWGMIWAVVLAVWPA